MDLTADRIEKYTTFLALAAGTTTEPELAAWLTARCKPAD